MALVLHRSTTPWKFWPAIARSAGLFFPSAALCSAVCLAVCLAVCQFLTQARPVPVRLSYHAGMFNVHAGMRAAPPLILASLLLSACSPELNWREVHATEGAYTILMPAKPASHSRRLKLDAIDADMTLRGAEVNKVSYVVGAVTLSSPAQAQQALAAMQTGMLRNIAAGTPQQRTVLVDKLPMTELSAQGKAPSGQALSLRARFAARGNRAYQAVVLGPAAQVQDEAAQTFLESFHPDPA